MTRKEAMDRFKISPSWLLANGSNFLVWGTIVWFFLWPTINTYAQDYVKARAPEIVSECFDNRDKNPDTFRGLCADLVVRVANEQTEMRLKALEEGQSANTQKLNTVKRNQETLIYQVGEVNKALPEMRGNINTIIRMLGATEDGNGRRQ